MQAVSAACEHNCAVGCVLLLFVSDKYNIVCHLKTFLEDQSSSETICIAIFLAVSQPAPYDMKGSNQRKKNDDDHITVQHFKL